MYKTFFTFIIIIFNITAILAQNRDNLLDIDYDSILLPKLIQEIESQTNYRFFYNPSDVDSLIVSLHIQQKSLPEALNNIFEGTEFRFAIDGNNVFLTKGKELLIDLPPDFFARGAIPKNRTIVFDYDYLQNTDIVKAENYVYQIGVKTVTIKPGNASLTGRITNIKTSEPLVGVAVFIEKPLIGVVTDQSGYYNITLPRGKQEIKIRSLGMRSTSRNVILYSNGKLNVELQEEVQSLKEVEVHGEKGANITNMQMGMEKLNIKTIKQVPTVFGEADVLRVILTLPGVKTVGEASTGFNVRGGSADQNLILFNDAVIYNPSHLFGFFSGFNPDVLKNVELYKSGIPAKYGGRLSSVLDITTREGNKKKLSGSGGIGLLTTRLTLEVPIIKDRTSIVIGARGNYSNWLLGQLKNQDYKNSRASFFDTNLLVSHEIDKKNSLYLSAYKSNDEFSLRNDTVYSYSNTLASIKWRHVSNEKFSSVYTVAYSSYTFGLSSDKNPVNAYKLNFAIDQATVKADFNFFPNTKHAIDFGFNGNHYKIQPGKFQPNGKESLVAFDKVEPEQALESALYFADVYDLSPQISINVGIRYSMFNYIGSQNVFTYADGESKEVYSITDTISYSKGQIIKNYYGPEYRASIRYSLSASASFKVSYNNLRQYIHLISNTVAISPVSIYKLSDLNIKPQTGDQFSLGFYKNFRSNIIETSVEGYYKKLYNYLDYKNGANLILNDHIETDVATTKGKAYGVEVMVKKTAGKLNGWVSYTYSRTLIRMSDPTISIPVNNGKYYPANFDKPHEVTFIGNYKLSHRFSISLNFNYSTGRPITIPISKYDLGGSEKIFYSDRNQYRIPDYYRADFGMNIEGNHKIKKLAHSSWTLSVYNITGRKNPYSVYYSTDNNGRIQGYKLSIFGRPIPTITYNFKF